MQMETQMKNLIYGEIKFMQKQVLFYVMSRICPSSILCYVQNKCYVQPLLEERLGSRPGSQLYSWELKLWKIPEKNEKPKGLKIKP